MFDKRYPSCLKSGCYEIWHTVFHMPEENQIIFQNILYRFANEKLLKIIGYLLDKRTLVALIGCLDAM